MSNVLKSLSDCNNYNSNDVKSKRRYLRINDSNANSSKAKTSKSSDESKSGAKEGNKRDNKWRCNDFEYVLKTSVWLNDIRAHCREDMDSVLDRLFAHINSGCTCVNICSTHLLIGNTYFEEFLFNQKMFENKVINEENKCQTLETNSGCDQSHNVVINDIPVNKESRLDANSMPELINLKSMSSLLSPLAQALDHWSKALELNEKWKVLTEETIIAFKIYYNLNSMVQIYVFYDQMKSRLRAAKLINGYCGQFGHKESEISLIANYYLVKTYIDLGALNKAVHVLTPTYRSSTGGEPKMPETYGKSLNLLAKCELDLLLGRTERAAKTMKAFLESDYLQKLTINRYYIKGLSLLLVTRLSSKHFKYSNNFHEFLEPIQMSLSILKRWYSWLSTSCRANNENQVNTNLDPIWYKYSVLNFAFDSMQLSANFYQMIEMPFESFFFYNSLFKLGRRYCAVISISKLLIIGSQLDLICDHKHFAQTKLDNALYCLRTNRLSSDTDSVFDSLPSSSVAISPDADRDGFGYSKTTKRDLFGNCKPTKMYDKLFTNDPELELEEECEHNQKSSVWTLKKKLMKMENNWIDSEDFEDIHENHEIQTLPEECVHSEEVLDLFFIKHEILFNKLLVNESDSKYVLTQINDIHKNSIESYAKNIFKDKVQELLNEYNLNDFLEKNLFYKILRLKMIETIARLQVETKDFEGVINTCREVNGLKCYSYAERVIHSNLLYFEAFSQLFLYKMKHNLNEDKVWVEFNQHLMEVTSSDQSLTPPRPTTKLKPAVPKAPKQKMFKNDEMNEYMTALSNQVYIQSMAKTLKSDENRTKEDLKLDFESLSITSETLIEAESMETEVSKTSTEPFKRITRSQTSFTSKTSQSNAKVDKRSKRSMSSKSKTLSEVTNVVIDLSEEYEGLDEVFEHNLVVNEDMNDIKDNDMDLETIISLLKRSSDLTSSHPTSKLFVSIHRLLTSIHSLQLNTNEDIIGYHFCETNSSVYRYRNIFINEKKRKLNRSSKYDLKSIVFNDQMIGSNNSFKTFTECLPNNWRIVQISTVSNDTNIPDLLVCRYQRGKKPVFLRIQSDSQKIIKHFMKHFSEIIERSNASIVNKDRETFWRLRYSLDEELMILLRSVEETWFGAFKGILFGQLDSQEYQQMCKTLVSYVMQLTSSDGLVCKSEPLLEVIVESLPSLKYNEFKAAMKTLFNTPSDSLISKCFEKYEKLFCDVFPIDNKESIFNKYDISAVGLILDKSLEAFPFESLPSLHEYNQSIFRTPSLRILSLMYNTFKEGVYSKGVNESNAFYVLNPADNLAKTEEYFKQSFISMKDWNGVIGKVPEPSVLKDALESKDTYIFFGHGAGASYYRTLPEGLDGCNINSASIVIGCSSGKLLSEGTQLESYGTPYRFMMNGSPCYVGVLWDVTDKDIDKFSDQLLCNWFHKWKPELRDRPIDMPITKAVSLSRKVCRLKYLIGTAPVVYGLPLLTNSN